LSAGGKMIRHCWINVGLDVIPATYSCKMMPISFVLSADTIGRV